MKIMVCYDESTIAKDTLREAQKHAAQWNTGIDVVSVVNRVEPIRHKRLNEMETKLEQDIEDLFDGVNIPYTVQLHVDDKDSGEKIVNIAEREQADLIFMGIRKRSRVGKLLFGSTVQYVILKAPCPVVTVNST